MCCLVQHDWETECIEEPDSKTWVLKVLEPDAGKLASPVLRGPGSSNGLRLPDQAMSRPNARTTPRRG